MSHFEPATLRQHACVPLAKWSAHPGIFGLQFNFGRTLHLELEQAAGAEQSMHLAHIVFDYVVAWNVLKNQSRKREIDLRPPADAQPVPPMPAQHAQIF